MTDDERVVYDFYKMVEHLMAADGLSVDESIDFIEYNTIRALSYAGEKAPIIMYHIEDI